MKKYMMLLIVMLMICLPTVALAEGLAGADEGYTWQYLGTIAGATAATLLIVQYSKVQLDKVWKIPTRLYVYVIALAILLVASVFTGGLTLEAALLAVMNAVMVSMSAYGAYEMTFKRADEK